MKSYATVLEGSVSSSVGELAALGKSDGEIKNRVVAALEASFVRILEGEIDQSTDNSPAESAKENRQIKSAAPLGKYGAGCGRCGGYLCQWLRA